MDNSIENRLELIADNHSGLVFLFDSEVLLKKKGKLTNFKYHRNKNGKEVREIIKHFDDKYIPLFIEDIVKQLKNGIDRNELTINIPTVKI